MSHAAERGHWYSSSGEPVYEVPRADGKGLRPATLADARKLGLYPGVTGVINCAAKPGLERWKREQVLMAALTLPRLDDEPESGWIKRVFQDSEEQAKKAAEKGTQIHAAIEHWFYGPPIDDELMPFVKATIHAIGERYGADRKWLPEKSFADPSGYGCKIDLVSPEVIIDFKTKEFSDTTKKLAWDDHAMQLSANRRATGHLQAKCANVFVSTLVPGLVHIHEWEEEDLGRALRKFDALLAYWKADRNYYPLPAREIK